jgi:RimJ/RimL family protein N-acetyltransferase
VSGAEDIVTERLVLKSPHESHRAAFVGLCSDAESMVFSMSGPLGAVAANERFDRLLSTAARLPYAKRPIFERLTGTFVGYAGLDHLVIDCAEEIEIGYRLAPPARGRGYATEACAALLSEAAKDHAGNVVAIIEPTNAASQRVVHKLGFDRRGSTRLSGVTFDVWAAPFGQYKPAT